MSRQMRLVAAVFVLATLMLLFFRSSSWDVQQLRMPKGWDAENSATVEDEREKEVLETAGQGFVDAEFKEEAFDKAPELDKPVDGGLQDFAPEEEISPGDIVIEAPSSEEPAPEAPSSEEPAPEAPTPEEPTPEEPTPEEPTPEEPAPEEPHPEEPQPPAPEDPTPDEPVPFSDVDVNDTPDSEPDSLAFTAIPSPPEPSPSEATSAPAFDPTSDDSVDWSRFAYTQYVTDSDYLCNSVMIFEALHRLGSKPDRVMMYPTKMLPDPNADAAGEKSNDAKLIIKARDEYDVKLVPIKIEHRDGQDDTWADSYTKLLAFNQTQYSRVLSLDSDSTILQPLDELFLMPSVPIAMPRAYWLLNDEPPKKILSSQLMLLEPSKSEYARIKSHIDDAGDNEYDMEIVNELYLDNAMVLPHRPYNMLTAEFRRTDHADYLGSDEAWDPVKIYNEAKFVHFSDWPVPKPWIRMDDEDRVTNQPACRDVDGKESCVERELWNGLYEDFSERKEMICKGKLLIGRRGSRRG